MTVTACSSDSSTSTSTDSSSASGNPGGPGGGGPGGGGGGVGQTFTAVDLDSDGVSAGGANTAAVVPVVQAFLATLDADDADTVSYDFDDTQARTTWSNYPQTAVPREGIKLSDLSEDQQQAALAILTTALSTDGATQDEDIRTADDYLMSLGGQGADGFGSLVDYSIAVYGTPSTTAPFTVQFGGHHLARNLTYNGDAISQTPQFVGTEPTTFTVDGTAYEPLQAESTALFALFDGLTDDQRTGAEITSGTFDDLVMGPGVDNGQFPETEGLAVSELDESQQQLVIDALQAYVGDLSTEAATATMAQYTAELDQTTIGWSNNTGPTDENSYLRIDGPSVWIEFVNTRSQSTPDIHFHSVYRDKNNDYGSSNVSG
ncbi:DUF3500 domain-containing protein [Geodermatophilaceae bacterium NBWT11]|nr:DUF3500 domain-containing protein [Geodermatophilaceae bacterium NBWT11]